MIRPTVRILLEIVGVIAGGLLVIAGIALWRLSVGPVEADFIRPYVEQALNNPKSGLTASVAKARISWRGFRPVLDLNIEGLQVRGKDSASIAAFRDATLGISVRGLLFGKILPVEFDINRPEIVVVRDHEGNFSLRVGLGAETGGNSDGDIDSILTRFATAPSDDDPLGRVRRVHIVDGRVVVDDQKLGISWSAPDVDLDVTRNAAGAKSRINLTLALPQGTAHIAGDANFIRADGVTRLSFSVENFDASAIAPFAKALEPLSALAMPLNGQVHASVDIRNRLMGGDVALHGANGKLVLPDYYAAPLALMSADLAAHFEPSPQRIVLDKLAIDLGGPRIELTGNAAFQGPAVSVDAQAQVTGVPLAQFDTLWPHGVGVGARDWVTANIPGGSIKLATAHWTASGRMDDPDSFQTMSATGGFDYDGLEVHYFAALPPVRNIAGHATFDTKHMDLTIDSGMLNDIAVSRGILGITGLDQAISALAIDLTLDGPVATTLGVLDSKPLLYAHKIGLDPKSVAGHVNARTVFSFPLIKDLTFAQVELGAKGMLDGIAVPAVVGPRDVTDGALALSVDKKGMSLTGSAKLSGVPLTVDWKESFKDSDKIRSRIAFQGMADDAGRTALGIEFPNLFDMHGKLAMTGQVSIERAGNITLDADADIGAVDIFADALGLHKPIGQAGTAHASFTFIGNALRRISDVKMTSDSVALTGSVAFAQDGTLEHAELPHVGGNGRNDYALTANAVPGQPDRIAVAIKGKQFDAAPLLGPSDGASKSSRSPRLDMTIDLDRVLTDATHGLDRVVGEASMSGTRLDRAVVQATAGGLLTVSYEPAGDSIALSVDAKNAGAVLAGLSITSGVTGGTLHIDGKTAGGEGPRLTTGVLDMRGFRLTKAPVIARLVNALSLTGFVDLLSGQGLEFDRLNSDVDFADGKFTFRNGRTAGALGISFEGDLDLYRNKIALKGTVVPADTLNSIIAAIPVIGGIVTGGDRGGLFGWTYVVAGAPDDPQVSVNPLSMFVPGFLRNLFFLGPSEKAPALKDAPPAPPVVPAPPATSPTPQAAPSPQ